MANNFTTPNLSPDMPLRSILRASKAKPGTKLTAATALLRGQKLKDLASDLGVTPVHLSRASGAHEYPQLKERAAKALGLDVADIWPEGEAA